MLLIGKPQTSIEDLLSQIPPLGSNAFCFETFDFIVLLSKISQAVSAGLLARTAAQIAPRALRNKSEDSA